MNDEVIHYLVDISRDRVKWRDDDDWDNGEHKVVDTKLVVGATDQGRTWL